MNKRISFSILLILSNLCSAQMKYLPENDTLRVQEIEDVKLHKTGNPNRAKILSSKSNLSAMENPQPIAIVTHEIIESQQAKQLSDVVKNANGVYLTSSRGASQESFGARGFVFGNENIFKNGLKINSGIYPEVTGLERVEILKGANAMLYGNVSAGGILNLITKRPRFNFGGSATFSAGSWNNLKPTIDFFGPLKEKIAFRINGSYEYADSFRDLVNSKKHYFNPSFAFNIGDKTQIIVEGDYLYNHFTPDFGIGSITDSKTGISTLNISLKKSDFLGANWQFQTSQQATTDIVLNHQFNENWFLNCVIGYQNYTKDYFSTERIQWIYNSSSQPDNSWKRPLNKTYNEQNYTSGQINLNGEFKTKSLVHKILIGADADYGIADAYTFYNPDNGKTFGTSYLYGVNGNANGIVMMNDSANWNIGEMPNSTQYQRTRIPTKRFGIYAQNFVEITKIIKVLAGIRYSKIVNEDTEIKDFKLKTEKTSAGTKEHAFSPKVGFIITPNNNFTIYGTYTNSFSPNSGFDIDGNALKSSKIDQYEIGLKKNILKKTVAMNLNFYQINQNDSYTSPYLTNGNTAIYKIYAGNIQSRGVELDITGNPRKNITLIGGISYNHSIYTKTPENGFVENQTLVRTPAITSNASAFYKFEKSLKGFIIGATAFYTGDRKAGWNDVKGQTQTTRMIDLKGFTTADLSLGYETKKLLLQGKIGNIFSVENFNVHENYSVNPITPRNYYITITYKL